MSIDKISDADFIKTNEELASNYALQVALQTMKERCQQLQGRLSMVEDENLQLKIEKQKSFKCENTQSNVSDVDKLHEQIAQLSRQKSQLTHHIYMVATENKHLWTRLSLLTEANESLGTRLNKISNTLVNQTPTKFGNSEIEHFMEISELPNVKDFDFTLMNGTNEKETETNDNEDNESAMGVELLLQQLKQCKHRLVQFLNIIKEQQNILKHVSDKLVSYREGTEVCSICHKNRENAIPKHWEKEFKDATTLTENIDIMESDLESEEVQKILSSDKMYSSANSNLDSVEEDRICPICGKAFFYDINFTVFVHHVQEHFQEEEERYQSDSLLYGGSPSVT